MPSSGAGSKPAFRSAPEENPRPEPVMRTARTDGSAASPSIACFSSRPKSRVQALSESGGLDGGLRKAAVAEQEGGRPRLDAVLGDARQPEPAGPGCVEHGLLVGARWEVDDEVEAGRDSGGRAVGEQALEGGDEGVAARAVDGAGAAQVAVELAAFEEVGKGELLHDRGAEVVALLGGGDGVDEVARHHEPAEPEPGSEGLVRGAGVGDEIRRETLDGADRLAVVAILGVVVVLEDHGAGVRGPVEEGGTPLRREDDAQWELVCGRDHD